MKNNENAKMIKDLTRASFLVNRMAYLMRNVFEGKK